jgi:hypothetical protein
VKPRLSSDQIAQLSSWVEAGPNLERDGVVRWHRIDLTRRITAEFGIELQERTVGTYLAKLGFRRLQVGLSQIVGAPRAPQGRPRSHPRSPDGIQKNFCSIVAKSLPDRAKGKPLEVWFQDEARG